MPMLVVSISSRAEFSLQTKSSDFIIISWEQIPTFLWGRARRIWRRGRYSRGASTSCLDINKLHNWIQFNICNNIFFFLHCKLGISLVKEALMIDTKLYIFDPDSEKYYGLELFFDSTDSGRDIYVLPIHRYRHICRLKQICVRQWILWWISLYLIRVLI